MISYFGDSSDALQSALRPGERLLWSGRPVQGLRLRPADALLIPFSLLWCGFAVFWEVTVIRSGAPIFMMAWGVPFIAVGLCLVFGRFLADAYRRHRTVYGLTEGRIIVIGASWSSSATSHLISNLTRIDLSERADGSGTIQLGIPGADQRISRWASHFSWSGTSPNQLHGIPDVRSVYNRLLQLQTCDRGN